MRKITSDIKTAFNNKTSKTIDNTETDGYSVWLHGNKIVKRVDGCLWFTLAGWPTVTTRERINGIAFQLSGGLYQRKNEQYATFENGQTDVLQINQWYRVDDGKRSFNEPHDSRDYYIVRFYYDPNKSSRKTGISGLTLEQAQAHCSNPKTRKEGVYFDGYSQD
jgi:hypothetical protein